jgi:hypothetical protein
MQLTPYENESLKVQRVAQSGKNPFIYAIERIIDQRLIYPDTKEIEVDNDHLGIPTEFFAIGHFFSLLFEMKKYGCFTKVRRSINTKITSFFLTNANIDKMRLFIKEELKPTNLSLNGNDEVSWKYNPAGKTGTLRINNFTIYFSGKRALIVDFFYKSRGGLKEWYRTDDIKNFPIKSSALGKGVKAINERFRDVVGDTTEELIQIREKEIGRENSKEQNFYRWAL